MSLTYWILKQVIYKEQTYTQTFAELYRDGSSITTVSAE